jgi:signal transduction histidine kinase
MARKPPSHERPAVGRLARFNIVATVVIAVVLSLFVGLGGGVAYSLVLVTAERNIATCSEALTLGLRGLDRRMVEAELRAFARLAADGRTDFPAFSHVYRPSDCSAPLSDLARQQLDARLKSLRADGDAPPISDWISEQHGHTERWLGTLDRAGHPIAVRVAYDSPAAGRLIDRRLAQITADQRVTTAWFPRTAAATPALVQLLTAHGLKGNWTATSFEGTHRSKPDLNITVNETKVQGNAIALAAPLESNNLVAIALADRTVLGGVLGYGRYVVAATLAMLVLVWGAAIAWIRGTRRQARLALQQGNFVAAVSHELRTPLTAIRGAAEMLVHDMVPDGKKAGYYQSILGETDRLSRMVEQILDFDRMQRGQLSVAAQPTDLAAVMQQVAGLMAPVAAKRDVQLDVVPSDPVLVLADPDTLAQALTNLLDNAIKFSPSGADVQVALDRQAESAVLAIVDSGPGVPKGERPRIFEAFYRIGDELTRHTKGSGLGLYLAHRYVTAVGGTIRVTDAVGGGARFEVELPLA